MENWDGNNDKGCSGVIWRNTNVEKIKVYPLHYYPLPHLKCEMERGCFPSTTTPLPLSLEMQDRERHLPFTPPLLSSSLKT